MSKTALVIGGGVSGCSLTYFLSKKGYKVTLTEKEHYLGGMAHTHYYDGHPYEFGPHVWFWPNDDVNDVLRELTDDKLYDVDRKLYSFTGEGLYRYPIHFDDIEQMPEKEQIYKELRKHRDENFQLNTALPKLGEVTFDEYFRAAVGDTLYEKFMMQYTHKMWGIPGDKLETLMVWADRIKDAYTFNPNYDPIKFGDETLGEGIPNWYPEEGWNPVWEKMTDGANIMYGMDLDHMDEQGSLHFRDSKGSVTLFTNDFDLVFCTLHSDSLFGERVLPANGRMIQPLLIPGTEFVLPFHAESLHFSDNVPMTRLTEMKTITRHQSPDSLLCLESPVTWQAEGAFPSNVMQAKHFNLRCYNWQTTEALTLHQEYVDRAAKIVPQLHFCGRHANFKYWGMPETVRAAKVLVEDLLG